MITILSDMNSRRSAQDCVEATRRVCEEDPELKELLWYVPKTQKALTKELLFWLYPQFRGEKTRAFVAKWVAKEKGFWEGRTLRHPAVFIELVDKIARRNQVRIKRPSAVDDLMFEIFCWFDRQDDSVQISDIVSSWIPRVCRPIRTLLCSAEKRKRKAMEKLLADWLTT